MNDRRHVVLVFGGRDYQDRVRVFAALDALEPQPTLIVHGACGWDRDKPHRWQSAYLRGADRWADEWARARGVLVQRHPARWSALGPKAGPIRNREMCREARPDLGIGFPGGAGTVDMWRVLHHARVPAIDVVDE